MNAKVIFLAAALVILGLGVGYYLGFDQGYEKDRAINSFEECALAGYPIMESYPEQCRTPDGRNFVRVIDEPIIPPVDTGNGNGIQGKVLLGPTCPVMQNPSEEQCADRLFETNLALTTSDGSKIVKLFSSNSQGEFRVSAPPGFYLIRSAPGSPVMPSCFKGETIKVTANSYTETTVYCDSGIR
ncbi:MAG: hypothetical protein Q7S54_00340 [bacterium]|nr:hypothetical protein [bacterium]